MEEVRLPQDAISTSIVDMIAHHMREWNLHWLFRLALFCEFGGHGACGILTKSAWIPYFGLLGISTAWAMKLMRFFHTAPTRRLTRSAARRPHRSQRCRASKAGRPAKTMM
jgi:hypothetical protein